MNFLARQVARSVGSIAAGNGAAAPRLPALFEPVAGAAAPSPIEVSAESHVPPMPTAESRIAVVERVLRREVESVRQLVQRGDEEGKAAHPSIVRRESQPQPRPSLVTPKGPSVPIVREPNEAPRTEVLRPAESDESPLTAQRPPTQVRLAEVAERMAAEPIRAWRAGESERRAGERQFSERLSMQREERPFAPMVPPLRPMVPALPPVHAAEKAQTGPPPIRVTIGRVDVRAVFTADETPRPAPQTPAQPTLSLDDYLKQRERGLR